MDTDRYIQKRIAGIALRIEIREKPWDLVIVIVLSALLISVSLTAQTGFFRNVLGLIFALSLPGYTIVAALFPKAEDIGTIERIALSIGLSIAVVPLIGLLLNYTPWGIRLLPILISLLLLIICFSIISWYRRSQISVEDRFYITISVKLPGKEELLTIDKILTILIIISVIIAIMTVFYVITVPIEGDRYTEFYIFDKNKTTENYPKNLTIGENGTVIIGVVCHEYKRTQYIVSIELVNLTAEKNNKTLGQYNLTLEHNRGNETIYKFNISKNGTYKLKFLLYINDIKEPYRDLHLWIDVKP